MDSVMDFVTFRPSITLHKRGNHLIIKRLKIKKKGNMRDVRDKKGKNLAQAEKMILHSSFAYSE